MNKFFIKGLASVSLTASVGLTVSNFCSAFEEFPDWFYYYTEIPVEGEKWFVENFLASVHKVMTAYVELGKEFNEVNKNAAIKANENFNRFSQALVFRGLTLNNFGNFDVEIRLLENFEKENLWWINGKGLFPLVKWYYMNNRSDAQKKAADFIKEEFGRRSIMDRKLIW